MTEDEMVGWHHQLNGHESEPTLGDSGGQGSLVCCSSWDGKESDRTEQLKTAVPTKGPLPWSPTSFSQSLIFPISV